MHDRIRPDEFATPGDAPAGATRRGRTGAVPGDPRANRINAANMVRSLLPLVVICLLHRRLDVAAAEAPTERVREVDPSGAVQLAAARASYAVLAPRG